MEVRGLEIIHNCISIAQRWDAEVLLPKVDPGSSVRENEGFAEEGVLLGGQRACPPPPPKILKFED